MSYLLDILPPLLQGTLTTLQVFLLTMLLAVPLGLGLALLRLSRRAWIGRLVGGYVWLMLEQCTAETGLVKRSFA